MINLLTCCKLPTIIAGLGYTANEAQLWSVIPYAVAAAVTVIVAFVSDHFKVRGIIMLWLVFLRNYANPGARY